MRFKEVRAFMHELQFVYNPEMRDQYNKTHKPLFPKTGESQPQEANIPSLRRSATIYEIRMMLERKKPQE